jgi:hypothetical protein
MPSKSTLSLMSSLIVFSAQLHSNKIGNIVSAGLNENIALTLGARKDCTCGRSCVLYTCYISDLPCDKARMHLART